MTAVRLSVVLPLAALGLCALALAGCETTGTGPGPMAATPKPPMTHSQAAEECWMGTEKSDAHMDLDKRADVVDRCIKDKMKGAGAPPRT